MKKKIFAMLLTASLAVGMLAGCASTEEKVESTAPATEEAATTDDAEPAQIVVGLMCFAPIDSKIQDRVEAAVNEKMQELINVTADFQWFDAPPYETQIPMMIQSGEQLDVIMFTPVPAAGFSSFMSQNQLMDISGYLDEFGKDIKSELGEAGIAATSRGDAVYGTGGILSQSGGDAIVMRTDVLEQIGMKDAFDNMKSWSDFEKILKAAVDAGYTGLVNSDAEGTVVLSQPFMTGTDDFAGNKWVDVVGDGNQQVYVDPADDKVKCYYASEDYKNGLIRAGQLYDKGLIYKDASTAEEYADTQIKNGVGVAMVKTLEYGWEDSLPTSCGYDVSVKFIDGAKLQLSTSTFTKFGFGVPVTSQEPEAAVKFINLMYSNNDVHNSLVYGEKDVDWVLGEDGTANFPEGVENAEYHQMDFLYGDVVQTAPWGTDKDLRNKQKESNATVEASKYVGFSIDNTKVANQVTACQNVSNEYKPMLNAGVYGADTEAKWGEYIKALEAAGINDIIAEYQSQLDAWLAAK